jgi:hypothetical protein
MKLTKLKTLTTVCPLLASVSASAGKTFTVVIPNVGDGTLLATNATPRYFSANRYADLQAACSNIISQIESAMSTAGVFVRNDMVQSTNILYRAIKSSAAALGGGFQGAANPNTVIAITQAAALADVIMNDVEHFRPVLASNTNALKLALMVKLTKLIKSAYHDLDDRYFYSSVEQCRHSYCYSDPAQNLDFLENAYFGETAGLASKFIDLYSANASMMSHNLLEMILVSQVSKSAAEVLSTSFYRRDYACAVTRLDGLNSWVQEQVGNYLSSPEGIQREQTLANVVSYARMQMYWAQQQVNLQNCR